MNPYDSLAYDSLCIPETHPERLAVLARIMGIPAADPARCRVLELGAASGGNLIPMAAGLPGSTFLGVDLSATQVAAGERLVTNLDLSNLSLRQADILDLDADSDPDLDGFDYVIAHGVYSWVPSEVRARMLAIARRVLRPAGVCYLSWNVLPGWRLRGMLRDILGDACRGSDDLPERIAAARAALARLDRGLADLPGEAARYLREEVRALGEAPDSYLVFEFLAVDNHPMLFRDFAAECDRAGLRYLCDSALHTGFPASLGDGADAALADIEDGVELEQWLDFLSNRRFRQSLLIRDDLPPEEGISLERFAGLAFSADLRPPPRLQLRTSRPVVFERPDGEGVTLTHPLTKAVAAMLAARYPAAEGLEGVFPEARRQVIAAGAPTLAEEADALVSELFGLFARDAIRAHLSPRDPPAVPAGPPRSSALARALVEAGRNQVPTLDHANLELDPLAMRLVSLMDGTRGLDDLARALGEPPSSPPDKARGKEKGRAPRVPGLVALLGRYGVLEPD